MQRIVVGVSVTGEIAVRKRWKGKGSPIPDLERLLREGRIMDAYAAALRTAMAPGVRRQDQAVALSLAAWASARSGGGEVAIATATQAIEIAHEAGELQTIHRTQSQFGMVLVELGRLDEARHVFAGLTGNPEAAGVTLWTARALQGIGYLRSVSGDAVGAIATYQEALNLLVGDTASERSAMVALRYNLCIQLTKVGDPEKADLHVAALRELAKTEGIPMWTGPRLKLASAYVSAAKGHSREAQAEAEEALHLAQDLGDRWAQIDALKVLEELAAAANDPEKVQRCRDARALLHAGALD